MNYVIAYINAIELARNSKFKEAIKKIEWLYRDQAESKKIALNMLLLMLKSYSDYSNMSLMNFYLLLSKRLICPRIAPLTNPCHNRSV